MTLGPLPPKSSAASALPHLAPIDGLRAVAVLAVMLYHLNPALLPGGFAGVDIFFVISGFVVSLSLPTEVTTLRPLLALFYARRATRILPALYACLLVSTLLQILFIPASWLSAQTENTGLAAVLGYSNVLLAHAEGDYFAPRAEYNIFTQTWSLGVEEQFYAVFPLLFLPWLAGRRWLSAGLFLGGLALSLGFAGSGAAASQASAFYEIPSRFWELALGVLAFQCPVRIRGLARRRLASLASLACACIIVHALATTAPERTPYPASLLPCCAVAILLALIRQLALHGGLRSVLACRPMAAIGRISYSLYLWHWAVFVLFRWTAGLQAPLPACFALLIVFCTAALSTSRIELPPRRWLAAGRITRRNALIAAATMVAVMYVAERAIWPLRPLLSLSSVTRHRQDWYPDLNPRSGASGCAVSAVAVAAGGVPSFVFQRTGCPPPGSAPRALTVIGDSHAGAYAGMLARYALETGARVVLASHTGCAVLGPAPAAADCQAFLANALAAAQQGSKDGIVFLPGLRLSRMSDGFVRFGIPHARAAMAGEARRTWRAASLAATIPMLQHLAASGASIVLEAPKPEFDAPTFRCADWFDRFNPICAGGRTVPRALIEDLRTPVMEQFAAVLRAVPGARVWDPLPLLCPGDTCSAYQGEHPLFFDGDHLSGYANRLLEPPFSAFLASLPREPEQTP